MANPDPVVRPSVDRAFERKVQLSRAALVFEQLWPRFWLLAGIGGLFVTVSLAGLWGVIDEKTHIGVLIAFGLAVLGALAWIMRIRVPGREEAIRRLERISEVPHRPASSYEDRMSAVTGGAEADALWSAHQSRLRAMMQRLRIGTPKPRTDRYDPFAFRALLMVALVTLGIIVGDSASDRVHAAFRFGPPVVTVPMRVDAWLAPPPYTGKPPVMLADGSRQLKVDPEAKVIEVPERSQLIVRAFGSGHAKLSVEIKPETGEAKLLTAGPTPTDPSQPVQAAVSDLSEFRAELRTSGTIRVLDGRSELASWQVKVTPDLPPKIAHTKMPERTARGGLKMYYKVEDDYGVAAAEVRLERLKRSVADPKLSWAARADRTGPRPPRERPPQIVIRLPKAYPKAAEGTSFNEIAAHPWAGLPVKLTLVARDQAGQTGHSETLEVVLPQRLFRKGLARAVAEQRRRLSDDPRTRPDVLQALEALTFQPEDFIKDRTVYLGLRTVIHRLKRDKSRATLRSVSEQLWAIALRIEDGPLSDAERALRDAQERLSQALRDGASEQELQRLMQELRQALQQFLDQMMRQAEQNPDQDQMDPSDRQMSQRDLEQMMRQLEQMMRQGSRDQAQEMMSQLREMLDQLQSGRMARRPGQGGQQQMGQMMDQFSDLLGRQQRLLDDTFNQQQGDGQEGQQGQQGRQGQQGQRPGQRGQRGPGQRGQRGPGDQPGQQQGQGPGQGPGDLSRRQGELRDMLGRLQEQMRRFGMNPPDQLDGAGRSMRDAEQSLRQNDLDQGSREEAQALDQLRQGAQQMMEQMMRQMQPGQVGQNGPLDPIGRPPRTEGPDLGLTVKVPEEVDAQRAREILEELRKRLGEPTRPPVELDYIERLLRRF